MAKISKFFLLFAICLFPFSILSAADYEPVEVEHGGVLRGLVKYPTETAPRAMFGTRGDPNCPAGIPQEQLFVKQENRGIKNVLIILDIDRGKPFQSGTYQLNNIGCRFEPRVQWVPRGTSLLIKNSDPTLHNVRALRNDVAAFNLDIAANSPPVRRPMVTSGLYKINCDRHLWMRAWIYVSDHPYIAVTNDEGRFELKDIPPGTYRVKAWHEGWEEKGTEKTGQPFYQPMEQTLKVSIHADEPTEITFDNLEPTFLGAQ